MVIVLCGTFDQKNHSLPTNNHQYAKKFFETEDELPFDKKMWFGFEQEYFLYDPRTNLPLGFSKELKQGQFYCGNGANNVFGRQIAETHLQMCLDIGLKLSGINAEVAPGQWEYQVGPLSGLEVSNQLWISRFILIRVAEQHNVIVNFHPKPLKGDWNGSGCHCNISTYKMRHGNYLEDINTYINGYEYIVEAIKKLEKRHYDHMKLYGSDNHLRMTGKHETSDYNYFTWSVGGRNVSVRVGNNVSKEKKGYFEDRRPSSNCDPYLVTSLLFHAIQ